MKDIFIIANPPDAWCKLMRYRVHVKTALLYQLHNKGIEYFNGEPIWGIHTLSWGEGPEPPYTDYRVCTGSLFGGTYIASSEDELKETLKQLTEELRNGLNRKQTEIIIDSF